LPAAIDAVVRDPVMSTRSEHDIEATSTTRTSGFDLY